MKASITGRLVLKGKLRLLSPLIIGSGKSDSSYIEVLKDKEGKPFIPATSFVGVLRHLLYQEVDEQSKYLWGYSHNDKGNQSALVCHDLEICNNTKWNIKIRDGVKIDPKTGTAEDGAKYDYEVVEPNICFDVYLEAVIREGFQKEYFKKVFATIIYFLEEKKISFGAKTTSGFGKCVLIDYDFFEFDFKEKEDVKNWLKKSFGNGKKLDTKKRLYVEEKNFTIDACFSIKNSLIIKSYSSGPEEPDSVHITSNNRTILPGTSIKGAIRSRASKILKTLGVNDSDKKMNKLFGIVIEENREENIKSEKIKSRVIVEETEIIDPIKRLQTRIKIDRFTGGALKTALFEVMPLWGDGTDKAVTVRIEIKNYEPWEAGLLLLVLKDLWNEDLPIGGEKNIGRGILKGVCGRVKWDDKIFEIEDKGGNFNILTPKLINEVNDFVGKVSHGVK